MFRRVFLLILCLSFLLSNFGCFSLIRKEIREEKSISSFDLSDNHLYFGSGYHLCRVDLASQSVEIIYTTNHIMVEKPIAADGVVYFGGRGHVSKDGSYGDRDTFYALNLQTGKIAWKFPLGQDDGYGTFGTYPIISGQQILVCARQHLYCLDRGSGKLSWQLNNWFGDGGGERTVPYVHRDSVYFKISEEFFTKSGADDGHWAVVALDSGSRRNVIPVADKPGDHADKRGHGIGALVDGVIYGATRSDFPPLSRFGALDLNAERLLWEVEGISSRSRPGVNTKYVFVAREHSIQALDRRTGAVVWSVPFDSRTGIDAEHSEEEWRSSAGFRWSPRFAATSEVVVIQGDQGMVALNAETGKSLWFSESEANYGDADPLISGNTVIASSSKECAVFALDLKTGQKAWSVSVPDCSYYTIVDALR